MRAPYSERAKAILNNPDTAKQLTEWLKSGQTTGKIVYIDEQQQPITVIASRTNRPEATHGDEPRLLTLWERIKGFMAVLLGALVNPFGS